MSRIAVNKHDFAELEALARNFARDADLQIVHKLRERVDELKPNEVVELAAAFMKARKSGKLHAAGNWAQQVLDDYRTAALIFRLYLIFDELKERGVTPFATETAWPGHMERIPDQPVSWDFLPKALDYLREPSERYGNGVTEMNLPDRMDALSDQDRRLIAKVYRRSEHDYDAVMEVLVNASPQNPAVNWYDGFLLLGDAVST